MEIWVKDPITKKKSVTVTMFVYGMLVCVFKLLMSGQTFFGYGTAWEHFSGQDFAMAVGALGTVYGFRRSKWASDGGNGDGLPQVGQDEEEELSVVERMKRDRTSKKSEDGTKPPVEG